MPDLSPQYHAYLASPEWRQRREQALWRAGHRCQTCNSSDTLDVHHRTYARFRNEDPEDLTVLCRSCHEKFHDRMPKPPTNRTTRRSVKKTPRRDLNPSRSRARRNRRKLMMTPEFVAMAGKALIGVIEQAAKIRRETGKSHKPERASKSLARWIVNQPDWPTEINNFNDFARYLTSRGISLASNKGAAAALWDRALRRSL